MRIYLLSITLFLSVLSLPFDAFAQEDSRTYLTEKSRQVREEGFHVFGRAKDIYENAYGYNTKTACKPGQFCLEPNSVVTCSSYTYLQGGIPGTKIQFCNINTIDRGGRAQLNKDDVSAEPEDVSSKKLRVATGFIEKSEDSAFFGKQGNYVPAVPADEVFLADAKRKVVKFEPQSPDVIAKCNGKDCDSSGKLTNLGKEVVESILPDLAPDVEVSAQPETLAPAELKKKMGTFMASQVPKVIAPACTSYFDKDGNFGVWGRTAIKSMKDVCPDCFFGPKAISVKSLCPRFNNLSEKEQEYFWVWVYTAMTQAESTCRPHVEVKGTKDKKTGHQEKAVGLLQLEKSWTRRKNRGPECATAQGQTVFDISFQFRCAASIIRDTRWKQGKALYGNNGKGDQYWHRLQTTNGIISRNIAKFPGCK